MAVIRTKEFSVNLGEIIKMRLESFYKVKENILLKAEATFQGRILEEGLSYQDQKTYRKSQVDLEKKQKYPDSKFLVDLDKDISYLNKMIRFEKIRTKYTDTYTEYSEGKVSIGDLIDVLERQLSVETDPKMQEELLGNLSKAKIARAQSDINILNFRVELAREDKSVALIDTVMGEIVTRRTQAELAGDDELVAALDVKMATLKGDKEKISTENLMREVELKVISKGLSASEKLKLLNKTLATANKETQIRIGNETWGSAFEYWTATRDSYINGSGTGQFTDFFDKFSVETANRINRLGGMNKYGSIPMSAISSIQRDYDSLKNKPEFINYLEKIENYQSNSLYSAVDKTATAVISEAILTGEWSKSFQALKIIQDRFGIDTSSYLGDLWLKQLDYETTTAKSMSSLAEFRAEMKGTSITDELAIIQGQVPEPEVAEGVVKPEEKKEKEPTIPAETLGGDGKVIGYPKSSVEREAWIKQGRKFRDGSWYEKTTTETAPLETPKPVVKPSVPPSVLTPTPAPAPAPAPVSPTSQYFKTSHGAYFTIKDKKVVSPSVPELKQLAGGTLPFEQKEYGDIFKLANQ